MRRRIHLRVALLTVTGRYIWLLNIYFNFESLVRSASISPGRYGWLFIFEYFSFSNRCAFLTVLQLSLFLYWLFRCKSIANDDIGLFLNFELFALDFRVYFDFGEAKIHVFYRLFLLNCKHGSLHNMQRFHYSEILDIEEGPHFSSQQFCFDLLEHRMDFFIAEN